MLMSFNWPWSHGHIRTTHASCLMQKLFTWPDPPHTSQMVFSLTECGSQLWFLWLTANLSCSSWNWQYLTAHTLCHTALKIINQPVTDGSQNIFTQSCGMINHFRVMNEISCLNTGSFFPESLIQDRENERTFSYKLFPF
jgi:hypothetical protein